MDCAPPRLPGRLGDRMGWLVLLVFLAIDGYAVYGAARGALKWSRARAQLARMSATTDTPVAEAPTSGVVELVGQAIPADRASVLEAPLSGIECVWWRVSIEESGGSGTRVAERSDGRDFLLDDGSGPLARVRMSTAKVAGTARHTAATRTERTKRFLAEYGIEPGGKKLLWFEEYIEARANVYVLGMASLPDTPKGVEELGGPFRSSHSRERLVVHAPDDGELVVSVGHEATLAKKLANDVRDGRQLLKGFGVVAMILSLVSGAILVALIQ